MTMASSRAKDGEDMTEVAGKMWEFLDKLAADRPDEYKKFIEQQLEEGKHMFTPPEPVYCLQCQVRAWVSSEIDTLLPVSYHMMHVVECSVVAHLGLS